MKNNQQMIGGAVWERYDKKRRAVYEGGRQTSRKKNPQHDCKCETAFVPDSL